MTYPYRREIRPAYPEQLGEHVDRELEKVERFANSIIVNKTPPTSSSTGIRGEVCWDTNYIYICIAENTWKRAPIATW
jgi:hypothetical protein